MTSPNNKNHIQSSGCLSQAAGCLVASLIFPFSIYFFGWSSFALGSMSCAFPSKCSKVEEYARGIIAMVVLVGGGFGIPLAAGILVGKALKTNAVNDSKHTEDNETDGT
jgi:hypothetical protein